MNIMLSIAIMFLLITKECVGKDPFDSLSLLQTSFNTTGGPKGLAPKGNADIVMAYVPYNFGHSVAKQAAEAMSIFWGDCGSRDSGSNCAGNVKSAQTKCTLKYTPAKFWPTKVAQSFFGNKTVFGILRDPYERMVAQYRGSYRFTHPELGCNVNAGVKSMMREYLAQIAAGNPYADDCQHLPQAEYFDQPFGATVAIDNRFFPQSLNKFYESHKLDALKLETKKIAHVDGCNEKWAADLDPEARALVQTVYKRDFDLLCQKFNYCDMQDNTCVHGVPGMCPETVFTWDKQQATYIRKPR